MSQTCPTCGSPVRVVGDTTQHYEPMAYGDSTGSGIERELRRRDDEIDALRLQLRTIAEHWPGKWSRYCCGCDDEPWPCQVVLDVVVPWMEPEEVPE